MSRIDQIAARAGGLLLVAAALSGVGCDEATEPMFTPVPNMELDPAPGPPVGARPPAAAADAGPDGGADGGAADASAGDGGGADGAAADASVVDAQAPDMAPPMTCDFDDDCVLAVQLDACDPCPVSVHVETLLAERCLAQFMPGAVLGAYAPADCWADCGDRAGEACFEPPVAPICVDRPGGQCGVMQ